MSQDGIHAAETTQRDLGAIFASIELSKKTWLLTSMSPGAGENGRYQVAATTEGNALVLDTRTGRLWRRSGEAKSGERQWAEEKTPWRTKAAK